MADSRERKNVYMESLKENLSGVSPQNGSGVQPTGGGEPDYYEKLKNESYKALLKGEVQAYNAKQQAMKYTTNGLQANGYGTQGISESASLGIGNTYQRALTDAQNEYDQSILAIDNQQKEAAGSEFESLATLMSSASSTTQLDEIMKNYGINVENGVFSGEYFDSLDESSKRQLKSIYALYADELANNEGLNPTFFDEDDLRYATFTRNDGTTKPIGSYYDAEVKDLFEHARNGEFETGSVCRMRNENGETIYIKRVDKGYQVVNRKEFEKASNRYSLTRINNANTWLKL
jgi:hypothetical protein